MQLRSSTPNIGFPFICVLAVLAACGTEHEVANEAVLRVDSDTPGVYLLIPDDALPADVAAEDITITRIDPADLPYGDEQAQVFGYDLAPDGLEFSEAVRLVVPFDGALPMFTHIHGGEASLIDGVQYRIRGNHRRAVVPLNRFSMIVGGVGVGDQFNVLGEVRYPYVGVPVGARISFNLNSQYLTADPDSDGNQITFVQGTKAKIMDGIIFGHDAAAPIPYDGEVIAEQIFYIRDGVTIASQETMCVEPGPAAVEFQMYLRYLYTHDPVQAEDPNLFEGVTPLIELDVRLDFECIENPRHITQYISQELVLMAHSSRATDLLDLGGSVIEKYYYNAGTGTSEIRTVYVQDGEPRTTTRLYPSTDQDGIILAKGYGVNDAGAATEENSYAFGRFNSSIAEDSESLQVVGYIDLEARAYNDDIWSGVASSSAVWTMGVTIREPSFIHIENCRIFDQAILQQQDDYEISGDDCSFSVTGEPTRISDDWAQQARRFGVPAPRAGELIGGLPSELSEYADMLEEMGVPDDYKELGDFSVSEEELADMQMAWREWGQMGTVEDWEEEQSGWDEEGDALADVGDTETDVLRASDHKRLDELMRGQALVFTTHGGLIAYEGLGPVDPVKESFKITVMPPDDSEWLPDDPQTSASGAEQLTCDGADIESQSIKVLATPMLEQPRFLSKQLERLSRGTRIQILHKERGWAYVRTAHGSTGYVHRSSYRETKIVLSSEPGKCGSGSASQEEIELGGRG